MRIIGLTGGIASGKSTVGRLLQELGVTVIDADQLAREVVEPGTAAHAEIALRWKEVVGADDQIDRARLGAIVFADEAQRHELTAIVIPRLVEAFLAREKELSQKGEAVCVFEAATLFEEHLEHLVDAVLLVTLAPEEQVKRLMARSGLSEEAARERLLAQWPLSRKAARSRWVVDNSGTEADLARSVRKTWDEILNEDQSRAVAPRPPDGGAK